MPLFEDQRENSSLERKSLLMKVFARFTLIILLLFAWAPESWSAGLPQVSSDAQFLVNPEILNAKIKESEKTTNLDEGTKKNLIGLYRKSLDNLETAASYDALADKFVRAIETAPADTRKIREKIERRGQQTKEKNADIPENISLQDIEPQLLKTKAQLTEMEAKVAALGLQVTIQGERPIKAGQRLAEIKKAEEALLVALKAPAPQNENPQVAEARHWVQQTQLQAFASETKMLNQELVSMPVVVELTNAQREEALNSLERTRSLVQRLEAKVNQKRQAEAAKSVDQTEEAMRQVSASPPLLQQAAAANAALSDELQSVTATLEQNAEEKDTLDKELKTLDEKFKNTKQKIELARLNQALGMVLSEQRRALPDTRLLRKKTADNEAAIAETGLLQVQHNEARQLLDDVEGYAAQLASGSPPDEFRHIEPELRKLLVNRRELLDKIITANQTSLGLRSELEILYRQLLVTVTSFDTFLAERLLWTRSTPALRLKDFRNLSQEAAALFTPSQWLATGKQLVSQTIASPTFFLACLVAAVLLWCKNILLTRLDTTVRLASNPTTYRFVLPLQAVGLTLLLALPAPLLLLILAWQLHSIIDTSNFSRAVATGLIVFSYRFYLLRSIRTLLLPKGLASGFFHWQKSTLSLLRREAGFLIVSFLPVSFLTQVTFLTNYHAGGSYPLVRLFFIATLGTLIISSYHLFHPKTGIWERFSLDNSHRLLARLSPLFFWIIILIPLVMIGLVIVGYIVTVGSLLRCVIHSIWFAFGIVVCHQLIERWLIQSSRRLALQKAMSLRAANIETKADQEPGPLTTESFGVLEADPAEDLIVLSADSRKLLDTVAALAFSAGLYWVWGDVLPALHIFNEFTLWKSTAIVNGQATNVPVTVADVGLTFLIGIITLTATRHFPSLLKIVLLKHLDMSAGARYTTTTLSRYIIGGTGLMFIAEILGFSWSQIQWLVAALGVGIGFGLQEIVANFISGLIILFERPIRVGDVVTIGTTDGIVTRIRIRATTIRDYDRKELLVPNKEFISGRLLNWSLSDPVIRLLVPVGIAYGSDVQTAMGLMTQAATNNTLVLDDPKPVVTFDSFGDNALLLTLRCFIGSVDDRVPAKSALHQAIDQQFREAKISMAFPQRDVHLDTNKPLEIRVVQDQGMTSNISPLGQEG